MNKALWSKKALAVPACAAIVIGGMTLVAAPANADPADLKVTSQSVDGRVLTINGTGTPGENIQLDENFRTSRHAIGDSGTWTLTYTIPGTDYAAHTYTVTQTLPNGLNQDGQTTVTAAAEQPVPEFAITSHSVSGRTVTVSGTGNPDNTVQIDPQSAPIVRHQIADDGSWSFTFDIPGTDTDSHEYTVLEENNNFQIQAQGSFTAAAEATTPASQFSLVSPKNGSTVDSRTVTFTGTGTPGDLVNVLDADGNRAAPQVLVADDGTWTTTGTFSDSAATVQNLSVNQIGGGQGQGEVAFTITLPAVATTPTDGGGTTPGTGTGTGAGTGTGTTGTGTGTTGSGTATVTGTDPGAPALPVVSG